MKKELHVTVDFYDDTFTRRCEPPHLDRKLEYFASLGVNRLDWIWDTWNLLYREPFGGEKNPLAYAAKKARALGMQVHALIKPFETGFSHVPHTFPQPAGMKIWRNLNGAFSLWRDPFIVDHRDKCFKRKPGPADPGDAVTTIKLVKAGAEPTRVKKEHLQIWTGELNGRLEPYQGEFTFSSGIEERVAFRPDQARLVQRQVRWCEERDCLILTLGGLSIPKHHRYIDVRCSLADGPGDFCNTQNELVEIYNGAGDRIPSTPGCQNPNRFGGGINEVTLQYSEYWLYPEVREFFRDPEKLRQASRDDYFFPPYAPEHLDGGTACVARGFDEYMPILNPVYPEVRDYWLGVVDDCIESGVAGVNIRAASHSCYNAQGYEYGFNEPVLEHCGGRIDRDLAREMIGASYTELLRGAKARLKARGLALSVHVNSGMLMPEGRGFEIQSLPPNVEWQWREWIEDGIADYVCLKDGPMLDSESRLELFIDRVTRVAGRRGIPVIYLNPTGTLNFEGGNYRVGREMSMVAGDERLAAFNLYESACITRFAADGNIEGSADVAALAAEYFSGRGRAS